MDLNGMTFQQLLPALDNKVLEQHPEWLPMGTTDGEVTRCSASMAGWCVIRVSRS